MRVVGLHDLADERGGLAETLVGAEAGLKSSVEDAAVHRLEPIAHIRERAGNDDRHRVLEERVLNLFAEIDVFDAVTAPFGRQRRLHWSFSHSLT